MTVLVTGGAGYVGTHAVRALSVAGRDVVILDSMERRAPEIVEDFPLLVGDIRDEFVVQRAIEDHGVTAVVHFAGYKNARESVGRPDLYFDNNVGGTHAVLKAMRACGVTTLVFSSSCSVYGAPINSPVDEAQDLVPVSPYGASKLMCEQMCRWYSSAFDTRYMPLRYFNAAGASAEGRFGEDVKGTSNLIPLAIGAALDLLPPLTVFGSNLPTPDGTCVRDYIGVEDIARAHVSALDYLEAGREPIPVNLGSGVGTSVKQILELVSRVSGIEVPCVFSSARPGDPEAVFADGRRANELLGWRPTQDLEQVVRSAWLWHSSRAEIDKARLGEGR